MGVRDNHDFAKVVKLQKKFSRKKWNDKILNSRKLVLQEFSLYKYTLNVQLGNMAAYFKTKAFGLVVVWTGCLINPASLIGNIKNSKNNKKCHTCRSLTKFLQKLFPKLITKNPFLPFIRLNAQIRLSAHLKLDA